MRKRSKALWVKWKRFFILQGKLKDSCKHSLCYRNIFIRHKCLLWKGRAKGSDLLWGLALALGRPVHAEHMTVAVVPPPSAFPPRLLYSFALTFYFCLSPSSSSQAAGFFSSPAWEIRASSLASCPQPRRAEQSGAAHRPRLLVCLPPSGFSCPSSASWRGGGEARGQCRWQSSRQPAVALWNCT